MMKENTKRSNKREQNIMFQMARFLDALVILIHPLFSIIPDIKWRTFIFSFY